MTRQHGTILMVLAASVLTVGAVLAQSQDRYTLTAANGIAFSQFRGYDAWQLVATSQPDGTDGCGTSKIGCMKAIVGNPTMIQAYRDGIPANGKTVPDGAVLAKIEWLKGRDDASPYGVTVSGTQTETSFMVKDSKRFPESNGWGYATFAYDAASDTFKPATTNPSFARACHACHTANAKARDFVYTSYAQR
jgi:hypothetical protein